MIHLPRNLLLCTAVCLLLNGCVVAAVADLAATTVVTAGKVAVKGTGALVRAAIPDGDDDDEKEKKAKKAKKEKQRASAPSAQDAAYPQPQAADYSESSGF